MSMAEKNRHLTHKADPHAGESRAHSQANRHNTHKLAASVNHAFYERHHGFESTKHKDKHPPTRSEH